jgi:hypothetical protein
VISIAIQRRSERLDLLSRYEDKHRLTGADALSDERNNTVREVTRSVVDQGLVAKAGRLEGSRRALAASARILGNRRIVPAPRRYSALSGGLGGQLDRRVGGCRSGAEPVRVS